jgi:hypothetical protein
MRKGAVMPRAGNVTITREAERELMRISREKSARIARLDALLEEAHDTLHKVLGVYISDVDSAHGKVSDLMRRIREARSQ